MHAPGNRGREAIAVGHAVGHQVVHLPCAQQAQADAEADRFRLADLRYRNGVSSYLDVLDAQRALFATQQALAQTQLAQRQNQVALYKALGGGWKADDASSSSGQVPAGAVPVPVL